MRKPVSSRWRTFAATTCAAMCATTGACASAAFAVHAGRAEAGGGEQIGHGLADPVLGDQLLDVEIDRGRSQARTVLHARRHRVRERRLRHAAAMVAAVDRGAMFGDLQAWLRQIEHLAALLVRHHRVRQAGLAVSTGRGRMALDPVGLVHRAEGIALVAGLAAARLAQPAALAFEHARRLFQTIAGWRLAAVGAGLVQPALQFGHKLLEGSIFLAESRVFRPQGIDITSQRADQVCQGWGLVHPCLESWQRRARQQNRRGMRKCRPAVAFETHRGTTTRGWLGVTYYEESEENGRRVVALPASFVDHFVDYRDSQMPQVANVVTAPMVLPDGSLFAPDGLDRDSRLYFAIEPALRSLIPNDVSREATGDALDFLCNAWLCDVAASFEGKCILIAAALTIIERALLAERPAFFVSAGRRGGGKTTAITMLVLAVTGLKPLAAAWSKNEEERRKAFLSYLSQALPVIVWDNLGNGEMVACKFFDALLTSETYSDRVLGATEQRVVPSSTIHLFSGNNVGPKGDTASRSFKARLEVTRPDPENRDFAHADPEAWTLDHRGRILQAMYTILLGNEQLQPGKAKKEKTRFKRWWTLVGSAVENAAAALVEMQSAQTPESQKACGVDFGAAAAAIQAENEDDIATAQLLDILYRRWPNTEFQANEVAKLILSPGTAWEDDAQALQAFFDPAGRRGSEIPARSIGKRLGNLVDGPVFCDKLELTLKSKMESAKKPAWFWITAKSSAA